MSEPMGCSDHFCQESAIPCLETVCEEARRHTGKIYFTSIRLSAMTIILFSNFRLGLDGNDLADYYFRDSFENSSESGYATNYDVLRIGPNRMHNHTDNLSTFHHHNNVTSSTAMANQQNAINNAKNMKKFSIIHAFIPSFIFVLVVVIVATIFVLESESDYFVTFKNMPEMMNLNYQYYQPFKDYILRLFKWKN